MEAPGMLGNPVLWVHGFHPLHIEPQMTDLTTLQTFPDRLVVQQPTCTLHILML